MASSTIALAAESHPAESTPDTRFAFELAMQDRDDGNLGAAIEAFKSVLQTHPNLNRVRLELAVAYYQALDFLRAREEAEAVLHDPATPEEVKARVQAFLDQVETASRPHKFTPYISIGTLYDSNVNAGPDNGTFPIPGGTITLIPEATERRDGALNLNVGITHRYLFPETVAAGRDRAALLWLSQASLYTLQHFEENDRNLDIATLSTGPSWIVARRWRARANLGINHLRLGSSRYAVYYSLNPAVTWSLRNQRTELTADLLVQKQDYFRSAEQGRDGTYTLAGFAADHLLRGEKLSTHVALRGFNMSADAERFSYDGGEFVFGVNWLASENTTLYGRVARRWTDYDGAEPAFARAREDEQDRISVGVTHSLSQGPLAGWMVRGTVTHTDNRSNLGVYDFARDQVGITLERTF